MEQKETTEKGTHTHTHTHVFCFSSESPFRREEEVTKNTCASHGRCSNAAVAFLPGKKQISHCGNNKTNTDAKGKKSPVLGKKVLEPRYNCNDGQHF